MVDIYAHPGVHLVLGRKGENVARQVVFDLRAWRAAYGDGAVSLCAKRAGDAEPYPCGVTQDEDTAVWVLRAADVDKPGWGDVQLSYYVGDTLAKSQTWRTLVAPSLCACGDPGEVQQGWLDQAGKDAAAAQQGAKDAQEAQKAAEDAAEAAKSSASAASGSSDSAGKSARDAAASASAAAGSATSAGASESAAKSYAEAAANAAASASSSQTAAAGSASSADGSASAAADSAKTAKDAQGKAEEAEAAAVAAASKPAYIGDNGNWYTWDTEAGTYSDSGVAATGPKGDTGGIAGGTMSGDLTIAHDLSDNPNARGGTITFGDKTITPKIKGSSYDGGWGSLSIDAGLAGEIILKSGDPPEGSGIWLNPYGVSIYGNEDGVEIYGGEKGVRVMCDAGNDDMTNGKLIFGSGGGTSQPYIAGYPNTSYNELNINTGSKNGELYINAGGYTVISSDEVVVFSKYAAEATKVFFEVRSMYDDNKSSWFQVLGNGEILTQAVRLRSSTEGSTKQFRITVDDTGTLSATEITT